MKINIFSVYEVSCSEVSKMNKKGQKVRLINVRAKAHNRAIKVEAVLLFYISARAFTASASVCN